MTLQWDHTPDLADDNEGAHYVILKRDTSTASWFTVAECVFSSKYTVTGLLPGRKYYFRVIAQNSIGDSDPLDSKEPLIIAKEKGEKRRPLLLVLCYWSACQINSPVSVSVCMSVFMRLHI